MSKPVAGTPSIEGSQAGFFYKNAAGIGITHWRADTPEELRTPQFEMRVVCVHLRPTTMTVWNNGVRTHSGELKAGAWLSHSPGEDFACVAQGGYDVLRLEVPERALSRVLASLDLDVETSRIELRDPGSEVNPFLLAAALEMKTAVGEPSHASRRQADGIAEALLAHLLLRHSNLPTGSASHAVVRGGLAAWQQRRAIEHLHANISAGVTLEDLAHLAGLSTFHFARAFKLSTGLPPHAYQRRLRGEKAKELLASTGLSISEIASTVGYDTPQAFSRMFRAEVGASPREYRREKQF